MSADVTSTPATIPSTSATRARPCDSPEVIQRNTVPQLFHAHRRAPNPADRGHSYEKVGPTTRMAAAEDSAGPCGLRRRRSVTKPTSATSWASPTTRRAVAGSADNPPTTNASFQITAAAMTEQAGDDVRQRGDQRSHKHPGDRRATHRRRRSRRPRSRATAARSGGAMLRGRLRPMPPATPPQSLP